MITEGLEGLQSAKEKFCSDLKFKILAKGIGDRKTLSAVKREHCDALTASRKGWLLCLGHTNHVLIRGLLQLAARSPCVRFASSGRLFGPELRICRPDYLDQPIARCKPDRREKRIRRAT